MYLYEYQGKELFQKFGVPIPSGFVANNVADIKKLNDGKVKMPVVVKSQILAGGRGKAGGVKFANTIEEAEKIANELFPAVINGKKVKCLLLESKADVARELYVSIAIDTSNKAPLILASARGGVEIEGVPEGDIHRHSIDTLAGLDPATAKTVAQELGLTGNLESQFTEILLNMYKLFDQYDAELVEVNPMAVTKEGSIIALDSKVVIDPDSIFRHEDLDRTYDDLTDLENYARENGYSFVELDGTVGVIANGAGLTMATMDTLKLHNLKPRNFMDLGGTDSVDTVKNAFPIMLKANPSLILVNIFGGVTKCDTVAQGIVEAKKTFNISLPMVVRLSGVHEEEGRQILSSNGISAFSNMQDAIKKLADTQKEMMR